MGVAGITTVMITSTVFRTTHLSGTGVSDYGDLLIYPFSGENKWENSYRKEKETGYGSKFSHENEDAYAGYYSVFLEDHQIECEFTTTTRCGYHRYRFPDGVKRKVIIDLEHRDKMTDSDLIFLNDTTIVGKRISENWAREQHFYFTIKLSEAPVNREFRKNTEGRASKLILEFDDEFAVIALKVGISAVDINGARKKPEHGNATLGFQQIFKREC